MIKLKVVNNKTGVMFESIFSSIEDANTAIARHTQEENWGKPEHTIQVEVSPYIPPQFEEQQVLVKEAVLDEQGNELEPAEYETQSVLVSEAVEAVYEDQVVPSEFEVEIIDITQEHEEQERIKGMIAKGEKNAKVCEMVLSLINGYNEERSLTVEQIQQMIQVFSNAEYALQKKMPRTAKQAIQSIEVDGVLVTEQMKQDCLKILESY